MAHKPPYDTPAPKRNLSDEDKQFIKQAILESVAKNTAYLPERLAESACKAICLIDSYKH